MVWVHDGDVQRMGVKERLVVGRTERSLARRESVHEANEVISHSTSWHRNTNVKCMYSTYSTHVTDTTKKAQRLVLVTKP